MKSAQIPAASLRSAPLHISKKGEQRCCAARRDALPSSAEGRPEEAIPSVGLGAGDRKSCARSQALSLKTPAVGSEQRTEARYPVTRAS